MRVKDQSPPLNRCGLEIVNESLNGSLGRLTIGFRLKGRTLNCETLKCWVELNAERVEPYRDRDETSNSLDQFNEEVPACWAACDDAGHHHRSVIPSHNPIIIRNPISAEGYSSAIRAALRIFLR